MEPYPQRKPHRLKNWDYSTPGCYFITICTADRANRFWLPVGARIARPQNRPPLSGPGQIAEQAILAIPGHYPTVTLDAYAVMPNHVHLLLTLSDAGTGRAMRAPTVSRIITQMKSAVTKQLGRSPWQKLFYDHIIRDQADYEIKYRYIQENPLKWAEDELYSP